MQKLEAELISNYINKRKHMVIKNFPPVHNN